MKPELVWLVWSVALTFVLVVVSAIGSNAQIGLPTLAGNRETVPDLSGWAGRAQRAHRNMLENLPLFAALALVCVVAGRNNATSALGAEIFFFGRLAHAVIYIAGIPWLRTAAYAVSIIGMVLIFIQLI